MENANHDQFDNGRLTAFPALPSSNRSNNVVPGPLPEGDPRGCCCGPRAALPPVVRVGETGGQVHEGGETEEREAEEGAASHQDIVRHPLADGLAQGWHAALLWLQER